MSQDSICSRCHYALETLLHVFRDCEDVKPFWEKFLKMISLIIFLIGYKCLVVFKVGKEKSFPL